MNIGEASRASGVSTKMIRYYETIGLIPQADRSESGYRNYGDNDVHTLQFIRRSRDLGFTVEQMADLLALWRDRSRASGEVKKIALEHVAILERKAEELKAMSRTLKYLAAHCNGDGRPDCPILDDLADAGNKPAKATEPARFGTAGIDPVRNRRHG
ncbi:Cu(I)-responsive transcriptional regulator [Ensifer adhaerens]|uniref:Cu(I)-responsive transcriptional regulator n=1 Tax=Ensifer adhaerens TaxID=106592 RepID=UPI001CBE192E|nr:Cu(I)-responsive transcriptional regulator [Ensifer adhaerens]MBZ7925317.1 Cu(I)-responsive transcriptional regulator [Ensifer adhaerens]UAX95510.1 Cu(I)-responsive transcriptional regulator [Ensifer adhaerens]UAY02598.1 Cu(I)-responsive transcriptional regulator [Ensifer adhaerens]UAY10582.1 Cu(I)-responsive transcriptional regulator [Ensifer adhaerens]